MKKALPILLGIFTLAIPSVALAACDPTLQPLLDAGLFKGNQFCTANSLLITVIKLLLGVAAVVAVLFIVIGGFQYITSSGNEEQAGKGKKTLVNALIGLIIIILAYTIVAVVINATGGLGTNTTSSSSSSSSSSGTGTTNPSGSGTGTTNPGGTGTTDPNQIPWDPNQVLGPNGMQPQ